MSRNGHRLDPNLPCERIADTIKGIRLASFFKDSEKSAEEDI